MTNFLKNIQRHEQRRQLLDREKYNIETENFYDSSLFVDWSQPSKYNIYFNGNFDVNYDVNNEKNDHEFMINFKNFFLKTSK